jgi:hypothetical protein
MKVSVSAVHLQIPEAAANPVTVRIDRPSARGWPDFGPAPVSSYERLTEAPWEEAFMNYFGAWVGTATVAALLLAGCSKTSSGPAPASGPAAARPAAGQAVAAEPTELAACDFLTAEEMSALLGGRVTRDPPRQSNTCVYSPAQGSGPFAELKFEPGDGQAAMMGAGFANRHEPGLVDPLAGVGDQALTVGPVVMIRRGEDLITIRVTGVDDALRRIKLIYAAINAKL